jgi:peptide/nickel transport system permease protein
VASIVGPLDDQEIVAERGPVPRSPLRQALTRLRQSRSALASGALLGVIVIACACAPLYADHISHTDGFSANLNGTTTIDGKEVPVIQQGTGALKLGETPIGPTWSRSYALGADQLGRDVAVRVLYGGRNSLVIGLSSALICAFVGTLIALIAGVFGGVVDSLISRALDVIWAFPVYLLAICAATVLITSGLRLGPITVHSSGILLPTLIIAVIYLPYIARPVRGQVLSVKEREYVEAAVSYGASRRRLIFSEILPNVLPTVVVLLPLLAAATIITESALSFLSIGVQPPDASWGTVIADGQQLLYTRPAVGIAPGVMLALTVLALIVLGDELRSALEPRAARRTRLRRGRVR